MVPGRWHPCRGFVTTKLVSLLGLKNRHGHWLCWLSTGRKNASNVKNTEHISSDAFAVVRRVTSTKPLYTAVCARAGPLTLPPLVDGETSSCSSRKIKIVANRSIALGRTFQVVFTTRGGRESHPAFFFQVLSSAFPLPGLIRPFCYMYHVLISAFPLPALTSRRSYPQPSSGQGLATGVFPPPATETLRCHV